MGPFTYFCKPTKILQNSKLGMKSKISYREAFKSFFSSGPSVWERNEMVVEILLTKIRKAISKALQKNFRTMDVVVVKFTPQSSFYSSKGVNSENVIKIK